MENSDTKFYREALQLCAGLTARLLDYLEPMHVSGTGLLFLLYIRDHKGCRVSEVAAALRMDKAAVTRGLAPLGELGYVEKQRAKIDTRTFNLYLTPAGRLVLRGARGVLDEWEEQFRAALSAEEYEALFATLGHARRGMLERRALGEFGREGAALPFLS